MSQNVNREFGPFPQECNKRGVGRTVSYRLLHEGLLETFTIGNKRFVYIDSLLALPRRLAERQQGEAA